MGEGSEALTSATVWGDRSDALTTENAPTLPDTRAEYDYRRVYEHMPKPAFLFDGRMLLNHDALKAIGFQVEVIGKTV